MVITQNFSINPFNSAMLCKHIFSETGKWRRDSKSNGQG